MLVSEKDSDDQFEVWSTNLLSEFITTNNVNNKFTFTVNERNNTKYPVIEGYRKARNFKMLN
jgi:hypothetical protein